MMSGKATIVFFVLFGSAALADEFSIEQNVRVFDRQGRETDVSVLRNETDERQPINVMHDGRSTRAWVEPGQSASVIVGPGTPGGEPLIILGPTRSRDE